MNRLLAINIGSLSLGNSRTVEQTFPDAGSLISIIVKNSITLIGIILIFLLIFGGVTFIINAGTGDSKKIEQGKSIITNALIGFAVVFCAYFIIQIIQVITGIKIL
ncbi:MAG: hypothetical protein WCG91_03525 [Candidatus Shapirobacteria bacterium]